MYLVHQIIVHILYAILCSNQRHMDEERMDTRGERTGLSTVDGSRANAAS